jgi:hypothetical protein
VGTPRTNLKQAHRAVEWQVMRIGAATPLLGSVLAVDAQAALEVALEKFNIALAERNCIIVKRRMYHDQLIDRGMRLARRLSLARLIGFLVGSIGSLVFLFAVFPPEVWPRRRLWPFWYDLIIPVAGVCMSSLFEAVARVLRKHTERK